MKLFNQGSLIIQLDIEDGQLIMRGKGWASPQFMKLLLDQTTAAPFLVNDVSWTRDTPHGSFAIDNITFIKPEEIATK